MSDSLAIAAVTTTIRNLLQAGFDLDAANVQVTTRPPDKVQAAANSHRVNLFLYHSTVDPHWRNMDVPWRVKSGETGQTPLPLVLYYLITAYYGDSEEGVDTITDGTRLLGSHRLLGRAASILHDHPILDAATINAAVPSADRQDHPYDQVEHVRITPQPMSLDELSKMWTGFQTQYRPSMAWEVRIVLIESSLASRTPLPVLRRGPEDRGAVAQADMIPPFPALESIRFPNEQTAIRLQEQMTLVGHHLASDSAIVRFTERRTRAIADIPLPAGTAEGEIAVVVPNEPADWPAGFYSVEVVLTRSGEGDRTTNALSFALAPRLTVSQPTIDRVGDSATIALTCKPQIQPGQIVFLLFGDRQIAPATVFTPPNPAPPPPDTDPAASTELTFHLADVQPGDYWLRLRVDGVDSLLVNRSTTPPSFEPDQKVTIQ